jgi:hypothetical protein
MVQASAGKVGSTMLWHDQPEPDPALAADLAQRVETAWRAQAMSVLEGLAFDLSNFAVGVHTLCDTAGFGAGSVLLTVAARGERISRTYVCNPRGSGWLSEFEKDLDAGLFGIPGTVASLR